MPGQSDSRGFDPHLGRIFMNVKYTIQSCINGLSGDCYWDWQEEYVQLSLDKAIESLLELREKYPRERFRLLREEFEVIG